MDNINCGTIWLIFYPINIVPDRTIAILYQFVTHYSHAVAAGTDPVTGEIFPADSSYNQPEIIRALFFAINELEALAQKGNQGLAWDEQEDQLLSRRFNESIKITELAKLHSRTYGAIKARLIKFGLLQK